MVILRTLISRYTLNKCFVYFKKDLLQFNTKYVHRDMYGWLWNRILFGLNGFIKRSRTAEHMVILRTLISRYTLNKCFVYFKKDLLQFNTKYVHRDMYGWLWNRILFGL